MAALAEVILLGLRDVFVPCDAASNTKSKLYRSLVVPHILDPLAARTASSVVFRDLGVALLVTVVAAVAFGATAGATSSLLDNASRPDVLFKALLYSLVAMAGVHAYSLATMWLLPGVSCLTEPGKYFDGRDRRENPVKLWLYNAFAKVPLHGDWKIRLQDIAVFVDNSRDAAHGHTSSENQMELHSAIERGDFDVTALKHAVGTASWIAGSLQLLGLLLTWCLLFTTVLALLAQGHVV